VDRIATVTAESKGGTFADYLHAAKATYKAHRWRISRFGVEAFPKSWPRRPYRWWLLQVWRQRSPDQRD